MEALLLEHIATKYQRVKIVRGIPGGLGDGLLFLGKPEFVDLTDNKGFIQDFLDATSMVDQDHEPLEESILTMAIRYGPLDRYSLKEMDSPYFGFGEFEGFREWFIWLRKWGEILRKAHSTPGELASVTNTHWPIVGVSTGHNLHPLHAEISNVRAELNEWLKVSIDKDTVVSIDTLIGRGTLECALALSGRRIIKQCGRCKNFFDLSNHREKGKRWHYCDDCHNPHRTAVSRHFHRLKDLLCENTELDLRAYKGKYSKDLDAVDKAVMRIITKNIGYITEDILKRTKKNEAS